MGVMPDENSKLGAYFCNQVYKVINFNILGELTTCCINWKLSPTFGSIKTNTIHSLWNSTSYLNWAKQRMFDENSCQNCSGLGNIFSQKINVKNKPKLAKRASKLMESLIAKECTCPINHYGTIFQPRHVAAINLMIKAAQRLK